MTTFRLTATAPAGPLAPHGWRLVIEQAENVEILPVGLRPDQLRVRFSRPGRAYPTFAHGPDGSVEPDRRNEPALEEFVIDASIQVVMEPSTR